MLCTEHRYVFVLPALFCEMKNEGDVYSNLDLVGVR
jgi:hypothetical protein